MSEDKKCVTPFQLAAELGHLEIVKYLATQGGCETQHKNSAGRTALHCASQEGHLDIVKYLVQEYQCSPMCRDKENITPFQLATFKGHRDLVVYFMNSGKVDPSHRDANGRTALHGASQEGKVEVVKLLVNKYGLDITDPDTRSGTTPLHLGAAAGHLEIVRFFHSKQANMEVKDKHGRTPLHYACQYGHTQVVQFLYLDCKCNESTKVQNPRRNSLHHALNSKCQGPTGCVLYCACAYSASLPRVGPCLYLACFTPVAPVASL